MKLSFLSQDHAREKILKCTVKSVRCSTPEHIQQVTASSNGCGKILHSFWVGFFQIDKKMR